MIWHRVADVGDADSVHIPDFCHAVEHLAAVCKLLYGQGTAQFDRQLKQWRARLRAGGAAVIDELERLRDAHGEHGDEIQGEINYLEANRERMNYPQYREEHLPIGSGTVESVCKNVAAARMKGCGMTSTLNGAQHMLQLRASTMSVRFAPRPPTFTTRPSSTCRTAGSCISVHKMESTVSTSYHLATSIALIRYHIDS